MTTGIYLVSACASADEFVAAFRRYADRTGLFVPIALPLPAGRRGQIALTLKDGGVMVEGEAEVIQSSTKPSGLHGRIGMTIRFVEPDEPSKIVLAELEKARLAMKPAPSSVPPRPSSAPDSPRPVVPTPAGRIDAANALAECVAIGDVATLREIEADAPKAGQKFVVPAIPMVGERPKSPTTPPVATRPKSPTTPPTGLLAPPDLGRPKTPTTPPDVIRPKTPITPPDLIRPKSPTTPPLGVRPPPSAPPPPVEDANAPPRPIKPRTPTQAVSVVPPPTNPMRTISSRSEPSEPVAKPPREDPTSPMVMRPADASAPPRRANTPSTPPSPRRATPVAPMPVARPPAKPAQVADRQADVDDVDELEPTDLAAPIVAPVADSDSGKAYVGPPPTKPESEPAPTKPRSGGMRASEIMAAVHTEDWTMTPDAAEPTVIPVEARGPAIPDPTPAPAPPPSLPTGDWTISADPAAPDGWAPPKVERAAPAAPTGNPDRAVASDKAFTATVWEDKPTGIGEPLVEIDPTLMEPLKPMPIDDEPVQPAVVVAAPHAFPDAVVQPPPLLFAPGPMPSSYVTPSQGQPQLPPTPHQAVPPGMSALDGQMAMQRHVSDAGSGFFRDSGDLPRYATEFTGTVEKRRRTRLLVIIMSAAFAVAAGFVLVVLLAGGGKKTAHARGARAGSAERIAIVPVDAAPQLATPPPVDASTPTCSVEVTSVPTGAEIALDKTLLGIAPGPFELPCAVEVKLTVRKLHYVSVTKAVTPTPDSAKITVRLAAAMFSLKVTSSPAGATITVAGKMLGVTPTTIRLPAFATSTIMLSKDGYTPDTQKLTPKSNGVSHHVILKRKH